MAREIIVVLLTLLIAISHTVSQAQIPVLVKDINPGSNDGFPYAMTDVAGTLYFGATDSVGGYELWKSDGTSGGTVLVKDIHPSFNEPYVYILAGMVNGGSNPGGFQYIDNTLYFTAYDGSYFDDTIFAGNGDTIIFERRTLWKSDGTASGTEFIADVIPNSNMVTFNNEVYFLAEDGLWKTNGTQVGTTRIKLFTTAYSNNQIFIYNNSLLFSASDGGGSNGELWTSDGTNTGTILLKEINPSPVNGSWPQDYVEMGGILYFTADNIVSIDGNSSPNRELWKTDGTESGTVMVKDIFQGDLGSNPNLCCSIGNTLYFTADRYINYPYDHDREIWKTDGTENGTVVLKEIYPGQPSIPNWNVDNTGDADVYGLTLIGNTMYFVATDSASTGSVSRNLWKSDGTEKGTILLKEVVPLYKHYTTFDIDVLISVGNAFYFIAGDTINGVELWKSDGTGIGTSMVADINPGNYDSEPSAFATSNGTLFFSADDGIQGRELWKIDNAVGLDDQPDLKNQIYLTVYPNPTEGQFTIEINSIGQEPAELKIVNLLGEETYRESISISNSYQQQLNVSNYAKGVYFLTLSTSEEILRSKFIVQ